MTMTMAKAKSSQKIVVSAVAVAMLLVAAGVWFVLVAPQKAHAKTLGAKVESTRTQIQERKRAAAAATRTQQIRTADLYRLAKAMPDATDMPDILLELSRVARETGIEFQSISPDAATPLNGYQVVPINLVFQGNFYDLADFVYRLRTLVGVHDGDLTATGRLFSIESIDFAEGEKRFPQILATIVVDAYVYGTGLPGASTLPPAPTDSSGTDTTATTSTTETAPGTTEPTAPAVPPVGASAAGATG